MSSSKSSKSVLSCNLPGNSSSAGSILLQEIDDRCPIPSSSSDSEAMSLSNVYVLSWQSCNMRRFTPRAGKKHRCSQYIQKIDEPYLRIDCGRPFSNATRQNTTMRTKIRSESLTVKSTQAQRDNLIVKEAKRSSCETGPPLVVLFLVRISYETSQPVDVCRVNSSGEMQNLFGSRGTWIEAFAVHILSS